MCYTSSPSPYHPATFCGGGVLVDWLVITKLREQVELHTATLVYHIQGVETASLGGGPDIFGLFILFNLYLTRQVR
jgi:hypothetical protein